MKKLVVIMAIVVLAVVLVTAPACKTAKVRAKKGCNCPNGF